MDSTTTTMMMMIMIAPPKPTTCVTIVAATVAVAALGELSVSRRPAERKVKWRDKSARRVSLGSLLCVYVYVLGYVTLRCVATNFTLQKGENTPNPSLVQPPLCPFLPLLFSSGPLRRSNVVVQLHCPSPTLAKFNAPSLGTCASNFAPLGGTTSIQMQAIR